MEFDQIKNGMKVQIEQNLFSGDFPVGTIGIVQEKRKKSEYFKVFANDDYWWYRAEEVSLPLSKNKK